MLKHRAPRTFHWILLIAILAGSGIFSVSTKAEATKQSSTVNSNPNAQDCQLGGPGQNIGVNMGVVGGYIFMRVKTTPANVYDGPYGGDQVLYTFQNGYHFITPRQQVGDWYEINVGEWMHASHLEEIDPSYFSGIALEGYPGYSFGWILQNHYASASPGGEPVQTQDYRIYRYTRITVCSVVSAGGWNWYLVGPNIWVQQTRVGLVKPVSPPGGVGGRWVAVDLYEQVLTAYEGGTMVFATLISSGLSGWDTRPGVFQVYGRQVNAPMSGAEGRDDAYRLENVPYAMYFDGDISLHGTYWHNGFGYRQSHGCVNLSVSDAAWVWNWLGSGSVYVYYSASY